MRKIFLSIFLCLCILTLASCKKCKHTHEFVDGVCSCGEREQVDNTVYTSESYNWVTPQTESLKLTQDYTGKDFIKDGIGVVTPVRYVDGDTTVFRTASGEDFTVRYNGINTPESTGQIQEWGKTASNFNKSRLSNATEIYVESNDGNWNLDSTGSRYLGYVCRTILESQI